MQYLTQSVCSLHCNSYINTQGEDNSKTVPAAFRQGPFESISVGQLHQPGLCPHCSWLLSPPVKELTSSWRLSFLPPRSAQWHRLLGSPFGSTSVGSTASAYHIGTHWQTGHPHLHEPKRPCVMVVSMGVFEGGLVGRGGAYTWGAGGSTHRHQYDLSEKLLQSRTLQLYSLQSIQYSMFF